MNVLDCSVNLTYFLNRLINTKKIIGYVEPCKKAILLQIWYLLPLNVSPKDYTLGFFMVS